jgi:hypothetical protein
LAERKIREIDVQIKGLRQMKSLLETGFHCRCLTIEDCVRVVASARAPA